MVMYLVLTLLLIHLLAFFTGMTNMENYYPFMVIVILLIYAYAVFNPSNIERGELIALHLYASLTRILSYMINLSFITLLIVFILMLFAYVVMNRKQI